MYTTQEFALSYFIFCLYLSLPITTMCNISDYEDMHYCSKNHYYPYSLQNKYVLSFVICWVEAIIFHLLHIHMGCHPNLMQAQIDLYGLTWKLKLNSQPRNIPIDTPMM